LCSVYPLAQTSPLYNRCADSQLLSRFVSADMRHSRGVIVPPFGTLNVYATEAAPFHFGTWIGSPLGVMPVTGFALKGDGVG